MEYKLAYSDNPDALHTLVNQSIKEGYEPIGGVAIAHCGTINQTDGKSWTVVERFQFCQAMIRPSKVGMSLTDH